MALTVKIMFLYYMDVSRLDVDHARGLVSPDRVTKSDKYLKLNDKKLSLGAEILLKHALSKIGIHDPLFSVEKYGKPFLSNYPHIHFNISHSMDYVVCAVSDSPVGVDMEHIQGMDDDVAKHYFSGSEYEYILKRNKKEAFFELWVLKESYMKMTGLGFHLALDEFAIEIDDEIRVRDLKDRGSNGFFSDCKLGCWTVVGGEYMLGVCSKTKIKKPVLQTLENIEVSNPHYGTIIRNESRYRGV